MWLTNSSIGRKLVMAITGVCLVLFVTFHCVMNAVALIWPDAYNAVCGFLGANWYALVASMGLAALFIIHIIYALWLTVQNRKARGNDRYNVVRKPADVEWSSQNMLVLGIVVLAFLVLHLIQFWARMQWCEIIAATPGDWYTVDGAPIPPHSGTLFIQIAFQNWWTPVVYIIGFVALWFHMNHGFWSMLQSIGWNGQHWLKRLRKIALWWSSIVIGLFVAQAIVFTVQANKNAYVNNEKLEEQYVEAWQHCAMESRPSEADVAALSQQMQLFVEKYCPELMRKQREAQERQQQQMMQYQQMMQAQQGEEPAEAPVEAEPNVEP